MTSAVQFISRAAAETWLRSRGMWPTSRGTWLGPLGEVVVRPVLGIAGWLEVTSETEVSIEES